MKLPIQKAERGAEPMSSDVEMWPVARGLMEKIFPEDWIRPWYGFEKNLYHEMQSWSPKVDINETETEFNITADMPGVKPENIKVEIAGENLMISGKSEEEKEEKGKTWHRAERRSGSFYREFQLPKSADTTKIEAMTKNGILTVRVMKKPEAQSKTVEVKVESQSERPAAAQNPEQTPGPKPGQSQGQ